MILPTKEEIKVAALELKYRIPTLPIKVAKVTARGILIAVAEFRERENDGNGKRKS